MTADDHKTNVYVGLAGEGALIVGDQGQAIGPGGMYRRTDGEEEWQSVTRGLPTDPQVRALLVHPEDPARIYAGTQSGVYRSADRGESWEQLGAPKGDVWSLAVHPKDHRILFAGYEPCAIYRSEDDGESWRRMRTEDVVFPHITMHPKAIAKRVIGIAIDPANTLDMYAAIEVGGLLASRDGGESWVSITDGHYARLGPVDLHGVQVSPASSGLLYIITQLAMFRSRSRGSHWELVALDEMFPGGSYCRGLAVAPDDPNTMYLAVGAGGGSAPPGTEQAGALLRSWDAGETWERLDLGETPPSRMFQVAIDRNAPSHIYCCTRDGQIFSSYDGGESWTESKVPVEMTRSQHIYPMACG